MDLAEIEIRGRYDRIRGGDTHQQHLLATGLFDLGHEILDLIQTKTTGGVEKRRDRQTTDERTGDLAETRFEGGVV